MLRSVFEGVTINSAVILEILRKQVSIDEILVIGGGAKGLIWRRIMANVFNAKMDKSTETQVKIL